MINKDKFMLLMERMEKRHSHEESMLLLEKTLLTEGFSRQFFDLLSGTFNKGTTMLKTMDVMNPSTSITLKKIDDLLDTADIAGNKGIKALKAELNARQIDISEVQMDGLENYFKSLDSIRKAANDRNLNSVMTIIKQLEDTNLNFKQQQKYIKELVEDQPDLVNLGMPDGKKLSTGDALENQISNIIQDNFISLGPQSFLKFIEAKPYSRIFSSYKKAVKNIELNAGDIIVTHPDHKGVIFILRGGDATSEVTSSLKSKGFKMKTADSPVEGTIKGKNGTEGLKYGDSLGIRDNAYKNVLKALKWYGGFTAAKFITYLVDCYINVVGEDKNYYDFKKEKSVDKGKYEFWDCLRPKIDSTADGTMPKTKIIYSPWWQILVPGGSWIIPGVDYVAEHFIDWGETYEEMRNRGYKKMGEAVQATTKDMTIKEILKSSCEGDIQAVYQDLINGFGSKGKAMNAVLNKVTGLGMDPAEIADEINNVLDNYHSKKDEKRKELEEWTKQYDLEIKGWNAKLPSKYKMKNGGYKENLRLFCLSQKASIIAKKLGLFKTEENMCVLLPMILDFYSENGFSGDEDIDSTAFSVQNCNETKKLIQDLVEVRKIYSEKSDFTIGLDGITCDEGTLGDAKNDLKACKSQQKEMSEEQVEAVTNVLDSLEISLTKIETPVNNYVWENQETPLNCFEVAAAWQHQISLMKKDGNEGLLEPLFKSGDLKSKNGKFILKFSPKTIEIMEGSDDKYSSFCNYYARNTITTQIDGKDVKSKKTQKECVKDFISHLETSPSIGCWGEFYG